MEDEDLVYVVVAEVDDDDDDEVGAALVMGAPKSATS